MHETPYDPHDEHDPDEAGPAELSKDLNRLSWGYNAGLPERFTAAWGARAIYHGDGFVDVVPDRTDRLGSETCVSLLTTRLMDAPWREAIRDLDRKPRPNVAEEFTVYDRRGLAVKVNTLASYGYLHVVAYLVAP